MAQEPIKGYVLGMQVAYFVHGRGRGHAARTIEAVERLERSGHRIAVFAGGDAVPLLAGKGLQVLTIASCMPMDRGDSHAGSQGFGGGSGSTPRFAKRAKHGKNHCDSRTGPRSEPLSQYAAAIGGRSARLVQAQGKWAATFLLRLLHDSTALARGAFDLLVSDADAPSIIAAKLLGLPCAALSHGLIFNLCALPQAVAWPALLRERINAGFGPITADLRVPVHFAPLQCTAGRTRLARPDLPMLNAQPTSRRAKRVLTYFRDDNGDDALRKLVAWGYEIVHFGRVSPEIAGVAHRPPNRAAFLEALQRSDCVVASAGNHLPAECLLARRPLVAMHAHNDTEQTCNAKMTEQAGYGVGVPLGALTPAHIARATALVANEAVHRKRVSRLLEMPSASEVVDTWVNEQKHVQRTVPRKALPQRALASMLLG